jgi:hypothetical protein
MEPRIEGHFIIIAAGFVRILCDYKLAVWRFKWVVSHTYISVVVIASYCAFEVSIIMRIKVGMYCIL